MPDLYEVDGERVRLNLHPGQSKAWLSRKRFIAVLAGTQGGKTSFGPWWLWREIQECGAGDYLAVTSTYDLFKLKMLPKLRETFEHVLRVGRYWAGDRIMELADPDGRFHAKRADDNMWGRIILRSAESDSGLEASTAKRAWLDEAGQPEFQLTTWEAVLRRLSLSMGRALLTTTVYNLGWLKTHVYDRWKAGHPDYEVVQFDSTENPLFPKEEAARAKASMPAWRYDMQYRGRFTRPAGQIYDSFNEEVCRVPRFGIPDHWERFLGLDFGGVNTAGVFYAAEPHTPKLYLYRIYKAGGRTAVEHTHHLLKGEPGIPFCVGGSRSEGQWRSEFRQGGRHQGKEVPGLPVRAPQIKKRTNTESIVELGINRVYGAHKRNEIYVFEDLAEYLQQKQDYSRVVDENGDPTEEIEDKEKYHYLDAERYIIGHLRPPDFEADIVLTPEQKIAKDLDEKQAEKEREQRDRAEADRLDREAQANVHDPRWWQGY